MYALIFESDAVIGLGVKSFGVPYTEVLQVHVSGLTTVIFSLCVSSIVFPIGAAGIY